MTRSSIERTYYEPSDSSHLERDLRFPHDRDVLSSVSIAGDGTGRIFLSLFPEKSPSSPAAGQIRDVQTCFFNLQETRHR